MAVMECEGVSVCKWFHSIAGDYLIGYSTIQLWVLISSNALLLPTYFALGNAHSSIAQVFNEHYSSEHIAYLLSWRQWDC